MSLRKGRYLEAKSIKYLQAEGAKLVFRGKGIRRGSMDGVCQVDLLAMFPMWNAAVEVTVPKNKARAAKRLRGMPFPHNWFRCVHVWRPQAKEPEVTVV